MRGTALATCAALTTFALMGAPVAAGIGADEAPEVVGSASSARAIAPWVAVSGPVPVITVPDTLRVGTGLQVIWSQTDGATKSIRVRSLDARARPVGGIGTVEAGLLIASRDPKLIAIGSDRLAVYAGIGQLRSRRSSNGTSWAPQPGTLTQSTGAQSADSIDAIDDSGTPFVAFSGVSPAVLLHRGFITGAPSDTSDFHAATTCCSGFTSLARDRATGNVWVSWHATGATDPAYVGTRVQKVWPAPSGPALRAPGSATAAGGSIGPGQPVALAARVGGGVWAAYLVGYPTSSTIRLWRVGTSTTWDVKAGGTADSLALTAAPGGRLWLSWHTPGDNVLRVARTDPAVSRVEGVQVVALPGGASSQLRATTTEGSAGPLDIIVSAQVPGQPGASGTPTLYALQVQPASGAALHVTAKPKRLPDGKVRVKVTAGGAAVSGAKVTFRGDSKLTNRRGKTKFKVSRQVADGKYRIVARKAGFAKDATKVRVV